MPLHLETNLKTFCNAYIQGFSIFSTTAQVGAFALVAPCFMVYLRQRGAAPSSLKHKKLPRRTAFSLFLFYNGTSYKLAPALSAYLDMLGLAGKALQLCKAFLLFPSEDALVSCSKFKYDIATAPLNAMPSTVHCGMLRPAGINIDNGISFPRLSS